MIFIDGVGMELGYRYGRHGVDGVMMCRSCSFEVLGVELVHDELDAEFHVFVELSISLNVIHWIFVEVDELQVRQVVDVGYLYDFVLADIQV